MSRKSRPQTQDCTCADFATNALGTCKHVEFVLGRLERQRGGLATLTRGFAPAHSEVVVQYGAKRDVRFRPGSKCPKALTALAAKYFDPSQALRPHAFAKFESFLSEAAAIKHDLRCYDRVGLCRRGARS